MSQKRQRVVKILIIRDNVCTRGWETRWDSLRYPQEGQPVGRGPVSGAPLRALLPPEQGPEPAAPPVPGARPSSSRWAPSASGLSSSLAVISVMRLPSPRAPRPARCFLDSWGQQRDTDTQLAAAPPPPRPPPPRSPQRRSPPHLVEDAVPLQLPRLVDVAEEEAGQREGLGAAAIRLLLALRVRHR